MNAIVLKEVWKDIPGYEGLYQVSNLGQVKSLYGSPLGKTMVGSSDRQGYMGIKLWKDGKYKYFKVHRIIAAVFVPNEHGKPMVNHVDGNKSNNDISNLEWCTCKENMAHSSRFGASHRNQNLYKTFAMLYGQGWTSTSVANKFGVSSSTVMRAVRMCGGTPRNTGKYNQSACIKEMLEDLNSGMSRRAIAKKHGCSTWFVRKVVSQHMEGDSNEFSSFDRARS